MGLKRLDKQRQPSEPSSEPHVDDDRRVADLLPADAPELRVESMA